MLYGRDHYGKYDQIYNVPPPPLFKIVALILLFDLILEHRRKYVVNLMILPIMVPTVKDRP